MAEIVITSFDKKLLSIREREKKQQISFKKMIMKSKQ